MKYTSTGKVITCIKTIIKINLKKKKKKTLYPTTLGIFNLQGNAQDTLHRQKSPDQAQDDAEDLPQPVNHIKKFILLKQNKIIVFVVIC